MQEVPNSSSLVLPLGGVGCPQVFWKTARGARVLHCIGRWGWVGGGGAVPGLPLTPLLSAVNDVRQAARSAASYMLFDPEDSVMQQNLVYYRFHRARWGLEEEDFQPREVGIAFQGALGTLWFDKNVWLPRKAGWEVKRKDVGCDLSPGFELSPISYMVLGTLLTLSESVTSPAKWGWYYLPCQHSLGCGRYRNTCSFLPTHLSTLIILTTGLCPSSSPGNPNLDQLRNPLGG